MLSKVLMFGRHSVQKMCCTVAALSKLVKLNGLNQAALSIVCMPGVLVCLTEACGSANQPGIYFSDQKSAPRKQRTVSWDIFLLENDMPFIDWHCLWEFKCSNPLKQWGQVLLWCPLHCSLIWNQSLNPVIKYNTYLRYWRSVLFSFFWYIRRFSFQKTA